MLRCKLHLSDVQGIAQWWVDCFEKRVDTESLHDDLAVLIPENADVLRNDWRPFFERARRRPLLGFAETTQPWAILATLIPPAILPQTFLHASVQFWVTMLTCSLRETSALQQVQQRPWPIWWAHRHLQPRLHLSHLVSKNLNLQPPPLLVTTLLLSRNTQRLRN